jgi:DnaJ-class molecular chaperone
MLHSSQSSRKLKLKVPLLDGTLLTFETRGKIMHGAIQEFEGRGMPLSGGRGHGKLFVQFQFTDKAQQQAPPRSSSRQRSSRHFESRYGGGGGGPFWE